MQAIDSTRPPADVSRERLPGHTLIAISGELDIASAPLLRERLRGALEDAGTLVIIDLTGVAFCDASGLAVLVGVRRRTEPRGVHVVLAGPPPQMQKLLHLTGLDRAFTIHRSVAAARFAPPGD